MPEKKSKPKEHKKIEHPAKKEMPHPKRHKHPLVSFILNLMLNGLGYVYNGKRVFFGVLLILAELGMLAIYYNDIFLVQEGAYNPVFYVMNLLSVAFAMDAYNEAREL